MLPDDQAKREKIADYLTGQLKDIPQGRDRALVITEALRSGDTIKPLVDTLKELGVQFDLASIGVETFQLGQQDKLEELMPELESKLGTRVYFGMEGTPKIYQKEHFAGVRKNPNTGASEPLPDWLRKGNQRWINQAREEAEILADDLAKWFRETNNQSAREG